MNGQGVELIIKEPPQYVSGVTMYGNFCSRSLEIRDAVEFCKTHDVKLMLGRMQTGYLGREVVTLADLDRWIHEEDAAAEWAYVADRESAAAEMGLLR